MQQEQRKQENSGLNPNWLALGADNLITGWLPELKERVLASYQVRLEELAQARARVDAVVMRPYQKLSNNKMVSVMPAMWKEVELTEEERKEKELVLTEIEQKWQEVNEAKYLLENINREEVEKLRQEIKAQLSYLGTLPAEEESRLRAKYKEQIAAINIQRRHLRSLIKPYELTTDEQEQLGQLEAKQHSLILNDYERRQYQQLLADQEARQAQADEGTSTQTQAVGKPKKIATLGLRQIALLYIYLEKPLNSTVAQEAAENYGHKGKRSGEHVMTWHNKLSDPDVRKKKGQEIPNKTSQAAGQELPSMIKDIRAIIPLLTERGGQQAKADLERLTIKK